MAVVFPIGKEVFSNCASCVASSGGTTNPSAGTTESWTMSTGYTSFPVATFTSSQSPFANTTSTVPANYFYVRDPADTTNEIVLVYNNNSSGSPGSTWYVERGMNGACVAHSSGATWVQVISPYSLQNMKQAPGNVSSAVAQNSTSSIIALASYTTTSDEIAAGTSWRIIAYAGAVGWTASAPVLTVSLYWGGSGSVGSTYTPGTVLAQLITATNCTRLTPTTVTATNAGYSFDVEGSLTMISTTTMASNLNMWYNGASLNAGMSTGSTVNTASSGGKSQLSPITISGSGPIYLTAQWSTTTATATWTAPIIFRDT
jgi:hypothetical protein